MDREAKNSLSSIIDEKHDVYCPYIGRFPLKILCYYTILQLYNGKIEPHFDPKVKRKIKTARYKKYEYCINCKCFPGFIWRDKELSTAVKKTIHTIFYRGNIKRAQQPLQDAFRRMVTKEMLTEEEYQEQNRTRCKEWRIKHKEHYTNYMRNYMRRVRSEKKK